MSNEQTGDNTDDDDDNDNDDNEDDEEEEEELTDDVQERCLFRPLESRYQTRGWGEGEREAVLAKGVVLVPLTHKTDKHTQGTLCDPRTHTHSISPINSDAQKCIPTCYLSTSDQTLHGTRYHSPFPRFPVRSLFERQTHSQTPVHPIALLANPQYLPQKHLALPS